MKRETIFTNQAPTPIGAYAQAVKVGNTVYLSGQIPLDPASMALVSNDIAEQVTQVFKNLSHVAMAAGGSLNHVVKLTIFLTDLKNFAIVNQIMAEFFSKPYPARSTVEVSALPKGAQVEIEGVMVV